MMKLVMVALVALAASSMTSAPCAAWQALVDDDSYSINRPREHWFRGPDGRLHRQWNGWTGYGFGNFFATGGHQRRHRRVIREAR
jgi:hypothetical protein